MFSISIPTPLPIIPCSHCSVSSEQLPLGGVETVRQVHLSHLWDSCDTSSWVALTMCRWGTDLARGTVRVPPFARTSLGHRTDGGGLGNMKGARGIF